MKIYVELFLRTVLSYVTLLVATRMVGKREINQLTFSDFASALAFGTIAAHISVAGTHAVAPLLFVMALWSAITILVDLSTLKSRRLHRLLESGPTVVIHNAQIMEERLKVLRMTASDLNSMLRTKGVFDMADVEFAIVEPGGQLSVLLKSQQRPVTPEDFNLPTNYEGLGTVLISDGQIRRRNLRMVGRDEAWLNGELAQRGLLLAEVFLAQLDTSGKLYLDLRDDGL